MANYAHAKEIIAANVYTNHEGKVTAEKAKTAINEVVDTLIAGGYLYAGVAKLTPTQTNPGSPDANVFYIATEPGTYTNFVGAGGSLVVAEGEVAIFKYNGTWSKEVTGAATAAQVNQLGQYEDNPEWVRVVTDSQDRILYGVKTDGNFYFGNGCPPQVVLYVTEQINAIGLDALLALKVDKVAGKSLINEEFANGVDYEEHPEYIETKLDADDNILEATTEAGTKVFGCGVSVKGNLLSDDENTENLKMLLDGEGRIIESIDKTGKRNLAQPTNQDDIIREEISALEGRVYSNSAGIVSVGEYNQIRENKCNNNVGYLFLSDGVNPFEDMRVIKNGKFYEDFSERSTTAKIIIFGDTHFGNTIDGTKIESPTIEDKCGMAFANSNSKNGDFSIILGDVLQGGNTDQVKQSYEIYYTKLKSLETPCFPIEGNHDEVITAIPHNEFIKTGIIEFNGVRIICFNAHEVYPVDEPLNEDRGDITDEVFAWLSAAIIDSYNKGFITILANHYELYNDPNNSEWNESIRNHREELINLCEQYDVKLYINGHEHVSGLIHEIVKKSDNTPIDMMDVEFGRAAYTYSVMEIKTGYYGQGFYIAEYDSLTNALLHTLFIPMTNQSSGTIYDGEHFND